MRSTLAMEPSPANKHGRSPAIRSPKLGKPALGLGWIVAVACVSPSALAQSASTSSASSSSDASSYPSCVGRTITPAESEAAHTIYLAGRVQYDDSNWDAAIAQFREAYRRDCNRHELLVILSRAYEANHDRQEAINALQTYLDRVPANGPDVPGLQSRLANIKAALAAEKKKQAAATTEPPREEREPRHHTPYPWILVGVGGAAMVTGGVLFAARPSFPDGCNRSTNRCDPGPNFDQIRKDAQLHTNMGWWGTGLLIGGGVAAVGGLVWYLLEPTDPAPEKTDKPAARTIKPRVLPSFGPGFAGAALGGTF